jgi:choice-of-anchor A domain-containing protein
MNRIKPAKPKRKGSAMILVVFALIMLLVMGGGLLSLGMHSRVFAARTTSEFVARCAADAGLTKALFEMNKKVEVQTWADSNMPHASDQPLPNCDATFSYSVTGDLSNGYTIASIGNSGQVQRTVNAALRLEGLFEYALLTKGTIDLKNGTTVDGYNFQAGDGSLKIGTNSTTAGAITAKLGVTIDGDVVVGVSGNPDAVLDSQAEASITGMVYPAFEENEFPSITVPQALAALPSQGHITTNTTISKNGVYDSISLLGSGGAVTVDGDVAVYVIGDIRLGNGDDLQIVDAGMNPDASLTIYVGGEVILDNGCNVNSITKDPPKLKIYALDTCLNIHLKNSSGFYGAIYAPNADVRSNNGGEIYGSIIANSFIQDAAGSFHYDASLKKVSASDEGLHFLIDRWQEQ